MAEKGYTRWMRIRLLSVAALLAVGLGVVLVRIWTLQVSQGDWLRDLARDQYLKQISLEPMRGAIVDRHGASLAVSVMTDSVFVMPQDVEDPQATARVLAGVLDIDGSRLAEQIARRKHFTWVARRLPSGPAARVRRLELPGVHLTRESRRYYPARELAAAVIGFAGDGRGLEGLELLFDGQLRGSTVLARGLRDARGNMLFSEGVGAAEAEDGPRLELTLDLTIQEIVERELARAVRESEARRGIAVVMEPHTGEVLAMASTPSFNPNTYWEFSQRDYRNRAVTDCFEPGSTMKVFSLAAALQAGTVRPRNVFDCGSGRLRVGPHTIHDHGQRSDEPVPLADVLIHSKNTCTAMIALDLGAEELYAGLSRFNFGRPTGVDLPGEVGCRLRRPERWYEVDLATIAFGQGVSVSALQLTTALCAVANGGIWMRPRMVRAIHSTGDDRLRRFEPEPAGRVLDARWAAVLRDMMVGVTQPGGTGTRGAIPGFLVAGKTGTAQKPDPIAGGYSKDKRVASFMGFVPADEPRIAALVVIDEPGTSPYGGVVAAPVFARMGEAILSYLGVMPRAGAGARVAEPSAPQPASGQQWAASSALDAAPVATSGPSGGLPDLRGRSVRAALHLLRRRRLEAVVVGSGRVAAQRPAPGTRIEPPGRVTLLLEHRPLGAGIAETMDSASSRGRGRQGP